MSFFEFDLHTIPFSPPGGIGRQEDEGVGAQRMTAVAIELTPIRYR